MQIRNILVSQTIFLQIFSRRWKRDQQKAEIIRNFPAHAIAAYGGSTLPLTPHPGIAAASYLGPYATGTNFNKAAIIASQAAAVSLV